MYLNIYERLMTFCSGGVVLAVTFILAEFCWRFGRFLSEIYFYSKHYKYNEKYRTALRHAFTFSRASSILMLTVAAVAATSTMYNGVLEQSHLLVIWWVFRYTGFTEYMYDYSDFIRSDSGLDGASAMVHGYFHAYLKLILPRSSTTEGIVQRIERYESQHRVQFAAKRLFILIPNSLHTKPVIESRLMERQDGQPLEGVIRDRAGVSRPYINSVYRILIENQPYYITIEGATPLLSYYDALNHGITTTEKMKAMRREIMIKFYRYLKTILQECPETQDLCELVLYNDYTADGQLQDVGEVLSVHIQQMWERMPAEQRPQ